MGMNFRKGMSQTIALLVAAVVILVTAAGVIVMFQSGSGELSEWISEESDEADCYGLQAQYQAGNEEALEEAEDEGCDWPDDEDD